MTDHDTELACDLVYKFEKTRSAKLKPGEQIYLIQEIEKALRSVRQEENEKHEALIGVLVEALDSINSSVCVKVPHIPNHKMISRCPKCLMNEALSHPLVQEYLKKEKV